jgi:hypothetical protein
MSDEQPPASDPMSGSQPPTDPPPPAPVNPYESPAAPPPPADPAAPAAPPPAAAPYGAPEYGTAQPQYPAAPGSYPGVPVEAQPSKAMAITALVLSLLCCTPVGFILAIIVILRSKDGRNHGKGLAIAALIVSVLFSFGIAAGAYGLTQVDWDDLNPVSNLSQGDCFNADGLDDEDAEFVSEISEISCSKSHDAEVLASTDLTADQAEAYKLDNTLCQELVTAAGYVPDAAYGLTSLTVDEEPNAGDRLACVVYNADGSKLDAPLPK